MVYQRYENTGTSKRHLNQNIDQLSGHHAMGGAMRRQSDIVDDVEGETSYGTSIRAYLEAEQRVAAGLLLLIVHMAIV